MLITWVSHPIPVRSTLPPGASTSQACAQAGARRRFRALDLIIAMDRLNPGEVLDGSPPEHHSRIRTLLEFAGSTTLADVPDPYYGDDRDPTRCSTWSNLRSRVCWPRFATGREPVDATAGRDTARLQWLM